MSDLNITLVCAIIDFLKKQLNSGALNEDGAEGLTIGIQCLETAYRIEDESSTENAYDLEEIFNKYLQKQEDTNDVDSNEQKVVAEILKNEGNSHMNYNNFKEAISCYTKAIELDPKNSVYYCNRAAALNSFGDHDTAIEDCRVALKHNPLYHKAYGRMGVAYTAKNQFKEARDSFKKALQLQPDNKIYQTQLQNAEEALKNSPRNPMVNIEINGTSFPLGDVENDLANVLNMASSMFGARRSC